MQATDDINVRNDAEKRPGGSDARSMKAKSLSNWKVRLAFGSAVAILLGVGALSYRVIAGVQGKQPLGATLSRCY